MKHIIKHIYSAGIAAEDYEEFLEIPDCACNHKIREMEVAVKRCGKHAYSLPDVSFCDDRYGNKIMLVKRKCVFCGLTIANRGPVRLIESYTTKTEDSQNG